VEQNRRIVVTVRQFAFVQTFRCMVHCITKYFYRHSRRCVEGYRALDRTPLSGAGAESLSGSSPTMQLRYCHACGNRPVRARLKHRSGASVNLFGFSSFLRFTCLFMAPWMNGHAADANCAAVGGVQRASRP
jgi:hypothetical protein